MKLWHLLLAGMVVVALGHGRDFLLPLLFAVVVATGIAFAVRLAPSLATLRMQPRLPTGRELLAILLGLVAAYIGYGIADEMFGVLQVMSPRDFRTAQGRANLMEDLMLPLWLLLAILPAAMLILRGGAMRQALAGLAAAVPMGIALLLVWQSVGKPWASYGFNDEVFTAGLALLPVAGLLAGLGWPFWWGALGTTTDTFTLSRLLRLSRLLWLCQAGLVVCSAVLILSGLWRHASNSGLTLGAIALLVLSGVWLRALARMERLPTPNLFGTLAIGLLLVILFGLSQLPALWILASGQTTIGDAGALVALLSLPVLLAVGFVCLVVVPALVGRIAGERHLAA